MKNLVIRVDAGSRIGGGHVMRCLALALAWQRGGGSATFLSCCDSDALRQRIESAGVRFLALDGPQLDARGRATTLSTLNQLTPTWVVLDGYHFDQDYQRAIRAAGHRLLVIDDTAHLPYYHADVLLNQNINAGRLTYHCDPDATRLLGNSYVLLRPEFLAWRKWKRGVSGTASKVLVTLGGGDPENVTLKVVQALRQLGRRDLEARIVVGPANPHLETLREAVRGAVHGATSMQLLIAPIDMPELMAWADVAVSAGGSTCWELAFMGLPNVVLVLAENQRRIAEGLDGAGIAINLGCQQQVSAGHLIESLKGLLEFPEQRRQMSLQGRSLVDGGGTDRVIEKLQPRLNMAGLQNAHSVSG